MKKLNRNIENGNLQKPINKKIDSESIKPERDSFDQKELDTLVQTVTDHGEKMQVLVAGDGTKLSDNKVLKSRAKRKIITQSLVLSLIDIAKKKVIQNFFKHFGTHIIVRKSYLLPMEECMANTVKIVFAQYAAV